MLIEPLRDLQRPAGGETETPVRFALQTGQVIEQRRRLRCGFTLLSDDARFAQALVANHFGAVQLPDPLRL